MEKHVLLTIGEDTSYLQGARFISSFLKNKAAVKITLFYVTPGYATPRKSGSPVGQGMQAAPLKIREAVKTTRRLLAAHGFLPERITYKAVPKQLGTVKDIIKEGIAGNYDAAILGRRGYTLFEQILSSSVSREILAADISVPLWICRRPEENRKNVLLCVDGSESSLRIADHVGFMLKDEEAHTVTIFHVDTGETKSQEEVILQQAMDQLTDNELPVERIRTKVVPSARVDRAILDEAHSGGYAVVAVGRVGMQKGALKEWLVGSRTMKLVEDLDKAVLWVSS